MQNLLSIGIIPEPVVEISWHRHSTWEFVYYLYGTGVIRVGTEEVQFKPKTFVCLPPHIPHAEYAESGYRNIHFVVQNFNLESSGVPHIMDNDSGDFYNILMQLYKEFHLKQKNWQGITDSMLNVLYQYILSWIDEKGKNKFVLKFENLLVSNISNTNFSLEESMKEIPLSEDYFRNVFKNETGFTPLQYLISKRISYAKNLLETYRSSMKISEIARMSGFDDPYYFSRMFKKVTGKSPLLWREEKLLVEKQN